MPASTEAPLTDPVVELARFITHDLGGALRFARLNLEHLEQAVADGNEPALRQQIGAVAARLDAADRLLARVRDYGAAVNVRVPPVEVNLAALGAWLGRRLPDGFTLHCQGPPMTLVTSRDHLCRVLWELLDNAVRHHDRSGGRINLHWAPAGGGLDFEVADDGPGVAPEHQARIVRPGCTLAPKEAGGPPGLGLAIVAHGLLRLGCALTIHSDPARARGTTVAFGWPLTWPAPVQVVPTAQVPVSVARG